MRNERIVPAFVYRRHCIENIRTRTKRRSFARHYGVTRSSFQRVTRKTASFVVVGKIEV